MGLGIGELILIILILLVVFGGGKLPQLGDAIGRAIRSFRRAASQNDRIQVEAKADREVGSKLSDGSDDKESSKADRPEGG